MSKLVRAAALAACSACSLETVGTGSALLPGEPSSPAFAGLPVGDASVPWQSTGNPALAAPGCDACVGQPSPLPAAPADPRADDAGATCALEGLHALRIHADASSDGTKFFGFTAINPQQSRSFDAVALVRLERGASGLDARVQLCGASWPDFSSQLGEWYGETIPNETWDALTVRWNAALWTDCAEPGCALGSRSVAVQLGTDLPLTSAWPSAAEGIDVASLRDDDRSGVPGVLARNRGPQDPGLVAYSYPPTSPSFVRRASEFEIGVRFTGALAGTLTDCDHMSGSAEQLAVGVRVFACRVESGVRCNTDEVGFIDANTPEWTLSSGRFASVRVSDDASCSAARAATDALVFR